MKWTTNCIAERDIKFKHTIQNARVKYKRFRSSSKSLFIFQALKCKHERMQNVLRFGFMSLLCSIKKKNSGKKQATRKNASKLSFFWSFVLLLLLLFHWHLSSAEPILMSKCELDISHSGELRAILLYFCISVGGFMYILAAGNVLCVCVCVHVCFESRICENVPRFDCL